MLKVYNLVASSGGEEGEEYCEVLIKSFLHKSDAEAYRELHCDSHPPQYVIEGVEVLLWWTDKQTSDEVWSIEEVRLYKSLEEAIQDE